MQKTSRINSDQSSIADNQKERKLTTPNRRNNTVASRDASDTPRNASTARAAPRPHAQRLNHRAAHRPSAQHLDHNAQHLDQRAAARPPTQQLGHRHSSSATAQHLDHRAAARPPRSASSTAQHIVHRAAHRPPRSTSTTDTAARPPTQHLGHTVTPYRTYFRTFSLCTGAKFSNNSLFYLNKK